MKRILLVLAISAAAGCAREEESVPAPRPVAKTPAPPPPMPADPAPIPPPPSPPAGKTVYEAATGMHLPAFTIRTMDHRKVPVRIDGEDLVTPCLWSVTSSFKGADCPLEGARFAAVSRHPDDPDASAEVYVLSDAPGLRKFESVLIVKGTVDGRKVGGGVRLYMEGYRFTVYTPLDLPAGEDAARFSRTLWFERISDQ